MKNLAYALTAFAVLVIGLMFFRLWGWEAKPIVLHLVPEPSQPRVPLGEAGMDPAALQAAVEYADARASHALVVARGGHIVFEKYWGDTTFDTPVEPGFAPVLAALAVGTAMNNKLIINLDQPVSNYLGDSAGPEGATSVRELLAGDKSELSLADSTDLLALVLERVGHQPYQVLVVEQLWKPMGGGDLEFRVRDNKRRPDGVSAACCVRGRIGDWMRVGQLLANDGIFEGNQFTPPRYVRLMLKPAHTESARGWLTRVDGNFVSPDVAWLEGTAQQRMWIVPSLQLVILRLGDAAPDAGGWDEALIPNTIIRGTSGWKPRSGHEGVDPNQFAPH